MNDNKFAVLILSHGRAGNVKTIQTLQNANYHGDWYILCDDEDEQLSDYAREYGQDKVLTFCKQDYVKTTDTFTNDGRTNSVVFARNAAFDIARQLCLDAFFCMDDDIIACRIRYADGKKLKGAKIKSLDKIFASMLELMKANKHISCMSFANTGSFIGGGKCKLPKGFANQCESSVFVFDR